MTYFDQYASRTKNDGTPSYYEDMLQQKINDSFNISSDVMTVKWNGVDTIVLVTSKFLDSGIKQNKDDYRKITFKDFSQIPELGDVFEFQGLTWLCFLTDNLSVGANSCTVRISNATLKWYDSTKTLQQSIATIETASNRREELKESKLILTEFGRFIVQTPYNSITKQIEPGQRFIINGNAYKVAFTDNATYVVNGIGLVELILDVDVINDNDDLVNDIADAKLYEHNYAISILNGNTASISQGSTLQLDVQVSDNNVVLSPNPTITYTSSDINIATVDTNGLVTAINSGGNCTITASYQGVSDSIAISISAVVTHNYTVDITPNGVLKVGQSITANALFKDNGVNIDSVATSWWVLADDDVSSTNLVVLTFDGNTATIKANNTAGYVRLHVDGYNCQNSIRLQVSSLW